MTDARAAGQAAYNERVRQLFRDEYLHFRGFGFSHEKIAARMGIERASLIRKCERYDLYVPEDSERSVIWRVERLVESGRPFTATELLDAHAGTVAGVLGRLERMGRIRIVGWAEHASDNGHRQRLWQSTAAAPGQAVAS